MEVKGSMCDSGLRLSYISIFKLMEDAVTDKFNELKINGWYIKEKCNAFWVYVRNRVKIYDRPTLWDYIDIKCYLTKVSGARLALDTIIRDKDGKQVAHGKLEVCAIDCDSMKICRISAIGIDSSMEETPGSDVEEIEYKRFPVCDFPETEKMLIRSTNIDFAHHMNNVEYLRFMLNTFSHKEIENLNLKEIEVVYVNQSYEGEELSIHRKDEEDSFLFYCMNEDKEIVRCEMLF